MQKTFPYTATSDTFGRLRLNGNAGQYGYLNSALFGNGYVMSIKYAAGGGDDRWFPIKAGDTISVDEIYTGGYTFYVMEDN